MNDDKNRMNAADKASASSSGNEPKNGKKYVVGVLFLLIAILLLTAIFIFKNA